MRKFLLLSILIYCWFNTFAQNEVSITAGSEFYITSGTPFTFDGISFTPSANFNIGESAVSRSATANNPVSNTHISRVYQFTNSTAAFSGSILFNYQDSELNGLTESTLGLKIHDGSLWQDIATTNDTINNYVLSSAISNISLNELTLAYAATSLPLNWGAVAARRLEGAVKVDWQTYTETNVSHFEVERSMDGRRWVKVGEDVIARNTNMQQYYSQTDFSALPQQLYYRIKQNDYDGSFSYSPIMHINEIKEQQKLRLYPNPIIQNFHVDTEDPSTITEILLFDNNGKMVKMWNAAQDTYNISALERGIYYVVIKRNGGDLQQSILIKQ